jgi:MFS family permease
VKTLDPGRQPQAVGRSSDPAAADIGIGEPADPAAAAAAVGAPSDPTATDVAIGPVAGRRELRALDQFFLSCFWFAYNFHWGALLAIVLPSQITAIVGDQRKELFNGLIPPLGAALSLVVTPLAGALSDRSASRFGRRRPFMLVGTLCNIVFLALMAGLAHGSSIGWLLICYLGVQLGNNWSGGPYAGLIPDVAPPRQRGVASGWLALMTALGTLAGAIAAGQLVRGERYAAIYAAIVIVLVVFLLLTLAGVRERPAPRGTRADRGALWRTFIPRGPAYRDFYLVLGTRALVTMGIYSVFTFFQFFLKDIIRTENPVEQTSYLIAIIIAAGVPTSLLGGVLSDRHGRKPFVYLSGGLMALASIVFIGVAFAPSLAFTFVVGALFGLGYGAYQAVDWALAIDVLPRGEAAAKDMGIWHVSLVLPQVLAPAITGLTLTALKPSGLLLGYTVVFVMTAVWFVLGTVFVRAIRGVR